MPGPELADLFQHNVWGIPWAVLALVALAIAIVYIFIDTSHDATGLGWIILRWFHSLCWLLLALAALCMARILPLPVDWARPLAISGGLTYAIFILTSLMASRGGA